MRFLGKFLLFLLRSNHIFIQDNLQSLGIVTNGISEDGVSGDSHKSVGNPGHIYFNAVIRVLQVIFFTVKIEIRCLEDNVESIPRRRFLRITLHGIADIHGNVG